MNDDHFTNSPEVANLLQRARTGDQEALGQLIDRFRPLLQNRAAEQVDDPIKARIDQSDIVQQTCLSAVRQFDQFQGDQTGQFLAWLLQIQRHNILNTIRHHRGAEKRAIDRESPSSGSMARLEGHLTSPTQKAIREEQMQAVESVLGTLPETQATAIRLRYFEHASLAEIAARLDKSEDACAGLLKRGMAQLRQQLRTS